MGVDKTKIGLTFPHRKHGRDWQWRIMAEAGASHRVDVAKDKRMCAHWQEAMSIVRELDTVYFPALAFVPVKGAGLGRLTTQLVAFTAALAARRAVGVEAYTNRRTDRPRELDAMLADAEPVVRGGGNRLPAGFAPLGRPVADYSEDDVETAARIWADLVKYPTWKFAREHMPEAFKGRRPYREFGPREAWAKKWQRKQRT